MGCCDAIAKYILFLLNFAVFVCGAVLLGVGIALLVDDTSIGWITDITGGGGMDENLFAVAVYTMVTVGSLLFIVGFFGCCGACKESSCMLKTYAVLVTVILLAQIAGGIIAAVFLSELSEELEQTMKDSAQQKYSVDDSATKAWDAMQIDLQCCGSTGTDDWLNSTFANNTGFNVPPSCCGDASLGDDGEVDIDGAAYATCRQAIANGDETDAGTLYYDDGCYITFKDWVETNSKLLMGIFFSLAGVELICILFACCLKGAYDK